MFSVLRFLGLAGALCIVSTQAWAQAQPPLRVMSLNMCTDQLVLTLLPPSRITSVTFLSHASPNAALSALARQTSINYGTAEEVLAQRPDLVVSGDSSTPTTRAILDRAGYRLYEVASADTFEEIRETTIALGRTLGVEERAETLLAQMDATLNELARTMPARQITVVAWDGGGFVPGRGLLFNEILGLAGGINIAAVDSDDYLVDFDLEVLLRARPDLIAYASETLDAPSLTTQVLRHPVVRRLYRGRQITYADNLYICGSPRSAEAARNLRAAMIEAIGGGERIR